MSNNDRYLPGFYDHVVKVLKHHNYDVPMKRGDSISNLIASLPEDVKGAVMSVIHSYDYARSGGKTMPFEKRLTTEDVVHKLDEVTGFKHDPEVIKSVYQSAAAEQVARDLQTRMGTDSQLPLEPPTRRDAIEAAFELHVPAEGDSSPTST